MCTSLVAPGLISTLLVDKEAALYGEGGGRRDERVVNWCEDKERRPGPGRETGRPGPEERSTLGRQEQN